VQLVLATGTRNRKLAVPGADLGHFHYLRDRSEADRLAPRWPMRAGWS
jgi:hypothetical protein